MNAKLTLFARHAAAAAAVVVVGCSSIPSVGPDYEEPEFEVPAYALPDAGQPTTNFTVTAEYKPAASNEDMRIVVSESTLAQWWKRFDDPVLAMLVEGGVSNNVGYLMAQRRLEAANYEHLGSYAAFLPKFTAGGGWARRWYGSGDPTHYNVRNAAVDGDWEIDIFGGSRRLCEAALAQAQAAGWTVDDAWVSLTTQIGETYINLRTTQARIDVARTNLVLQSETYDILKSRLDSGIGDELAVNQCAYVVEQTRARIPSLLAQEEKLKNALAILAGEMPGSLHDLLKPLDESRDWLLAPQKVSELPLDMLRGRPDVKALERRLAAKHVKRQLRHLLRGEKPVAGFRQRPEPVVQSPRRSTGEDGKGVLQRLLLGEKRGNPRARLLHDVGALVYGKLVADAGV